MFTSTKPILEIDSEGTEVAYLQTILKVLRYRTNEINGVFDYNTEHQLKTFQAKNELNISGIADEDTWKALENKINKLSEHSVGLKVPMLNITIPIWGVILIGAIGISSVVAFMIYLKGGK